MFCWLLPFACSGRPLYIFPWCVLAWHAVFCFYFASCSMSEPNIWVPSPATPPFWGLSLGQCFVFFFFFATSYFACIIFKLHQIIIPVSSNAWYFMLRGLIFTIKYILFFDCIPLQLIHILIPLVYYLNLRIFLIPRVSVPTSIPLLSCNAALTG